MADYLTKLNDNELTELAEQFYATLNAAPATYSAAKTAVDNFKTKKDGFASDLTAHTAARANARARTQTKEASRTELETVIRFLVKQAKLNGAADAEIKALGISTDTAAALPSTATRPTGSVDTSRRFVHTIRFADEAAPDSKRLPRGVLGCEIYQKIGGAPPADFKECVFRGLDTKTPYNWDFEAADVGKMVHYMLRWRLRDESISAWSETVSATVTG